MLFQPQEHDPSVRLLTLNLACLLNFRVAVSAVFASERHDNDFTEVGDDRKKHSSHALRKGMTS